MSCIMPHVCMKVYCHEYFHDKNSVSIEMIHVFTLMVIKFKLKLS